MFLFQNQDARHQSGDLSGAHYVDPELWALVNVRDDTVYCFGSLQFGCCSVWRTISLHRLKTNNNKCYYMSIVYKCNQSISVKVLRETMTTARLQNKCGYTIRLASSTSILTSQLSGVRNILNIFAVIMLLEMTCSGIVPNMVSNGKVLKKEEEHVYFMYAILIHHMVQSYSWAVASTDAYRRFVTFDEITC